MGRLEKVGAAVVGVLLCIIIVVGLLNKNDGKQEQTDASHEMGLVTPTNNKDPKTTGKKPESGSESNVVSLEEQLGSEDLAKKARREELARIAAEKRAKEGEKKDDVAAKDETQKPKPPVGPGSEPVKEPAGSWPKDYVVQKNDTLGEICRREYADLGMVASVLAANPGLKPRSMRSGITIKLPAPRERSATAEPEQGGSGSHGAVVASRRPSFITSRHIHENNGGTLEKLVSAKGGKLYTVKRGDNLSSIAQRELGSIKYVRSIVELNSKLLSSEKTPLQVGWKLELPNLN